MKENRTSRINVKRVTFYANEAYYANVIYLHCLALNSSREFFEILRAWDSAEGFDLWRRYAGYWHVLYVH